MGRATQKRELTVAAGLYVLRYLGGGDFRASPSAVVRPVPEASGDIEVICAPGIAVGEMVGPGSNVVLVARRPGKVEVLVEAMPGGTSLDAKFTLDLLGAAQAASSPKSAFEPAEPRGHDADADAAPILAVAAHVTRRGDVSADADGWVGGPRTPSAIEGVEIRSSTADVGIAVQYTNAVERGQWSDWVSPGVFAGTRQRANSLTGLRLKLVGPRSTEFEMSVEAMFLGSPASVERGREIELTTPGRGDPLVGLKVALVPSRPNRTDHAERRPARVRVFR